MNPIDGSKLPAGSTLYLWGFSTQNTFGKADASTIRWIMDGKEIARGSLNVYSIAPPEGKHSCKLQIGDGSNTIEKSVSFRTISLPDLSKKIED